jgi:hypothetical protein
MMRIEIEIDDSLARRRLDQLPGRVTSAIEAALARGAMEMARTARGYAPKAFGTLTNSIKADKVEPLHYVVAPHVNYGPFVERGRGAGKQPGTANGLMEWVRQKTRLTGKDLERKTYVIARAIGRRGIRRRAYMRPAYLIHSDMIIARVRESAALAAREAARG